VLTAGFASRLRPLSTVRAKAALPVAGTPLVVRILQWLRREGVGNVVLNLHHLPESIASCVGEGSELGLRVRYSWELPLLGSAGGPRRALPLLDARTFLIVNGDTLTNEQLAPLLAQHRVTGALVTMALVPNHRPERYGGVVVDGSGEVTGFVRRGSDQVSYHFFGVQVVEASVFEPLSPDTPAETVGALYPALIRERPGSVRAYRSHASWLDIGTPADYLATCLAVSNEEGQPLLPGPGSNVASSATIERSVLWDDVTAGPDVHVSHCVVCDGVELPAGTSWHDATIRVSGIDLVPGERRVGTLAVGALGSAADGS
jgi:NDP-sugar pyrophosphorylase family protein